MFSAVTANAQFGAAIVTEQNNCLVPDGNRTVRVFPCKFGGARYNIYNGIVKTADNFCFDHKVPPGTSPRNVDDPSVILYKCNGTKTQVWYFIRAGRGKGLVQNAANPEVCLNIEGGNDSQGSRIIVWPCGYNNPAANEKFYVGERVGLSDVAKLNLSPNVMRALANGGVATFSNGNRLIGQDGATMVAAGAGNMVAAGAGNMIAAGAGNLIGNDGAGVVGNNGMALVGNDGSSLRRFLGGGQVVSFH